MTDDLHFSVINEAHDRADRLRRIRNLTNLSRKELCEKAGININTYIGYEVGRYGGLTKKGANKIINYAATQGVYSSMEWVMHGIGQAPRVVTDIQQDCSRTNDIYYLGGKNEEQKISEEINLFGNHYSNTTNYQIIDDGMFPTYNISDYVSGVIQLGDEINFLIGFDCIVKTESGEILVRNLRQGTKKNHYTLICNNPKTNINLPVMYNIKLLFAARIIWHRRYFNQQVEGIENAN